MFLFRLSLSVLCIFLGLCCVLPVDAFAATASPCLASNASEVEIKNILDKVIRPNTEQLQLIVLPDCRGYSLRQPNQPTKWFFHVFLYNPGPTTKVIYTYSGHPMQITPKPRTGHLFIPILRKNNIPIFDRLYYQKIYQNPSAIFSGNIPDPLSEHFSQSKPLPPIQLASLQQTDTLLAMRGRTPGHAILVGEYFKTGIELFRSLKQPQQSTIFPDDPSLLPFLFRYNHKAFPYNHPAKYQIQFAFHQGKGLPSSNPRNWPYWQGTIYSNIVNFEVK